MHLLSIAACAAPLAGMLVLLPAPSAEVAPAGDAGAGEAVFRRDCSACHAIDAADRRRSGPPLGGILDRPAGRSPGYGYSAALATSDIVWDAPSLSAFLADPSGFLPGNRMAFPGLPADPRRSDVIAYLGRR